MDTEHTTILSPARRAQRCRAGLLAGVVLVTGASLARDLIRADFSPSAVPQGEKRASDRPVPNKLTTPDLKSSAAASQDTTTSSTSSEMASSTKTDFVSLF